MSKRARLWIPCMALSISVFLSACDSGTGPTPTLVSPGGGTGGTPTAQGAKTPGTVQPSATEDPSVLVRIGLAFATSGDNGPYGQSQRHAAEMAWHEIANNGGINGHKIAATFEDTVSNPDKTRSFFQRYIGTDDVLAIVGPTLSAEAKVADPVAQQSQVPVLAVSNPSGNVTATGDFVFSDTPSESQVIAETVKQAKDKLGIAKVSGIYQSDDYQSQADYYLFRTELQKNNIEILSETSFDGSSADYKPLLAKIKAENPDAIVVSSLLKPAESILQARKDVGIDPKVHIIGGEGLDSSALIKAAGPAAEGLVVGTTWNSSATDDLSQKFVANYMKQYGAEPDALAAQAYAGFYILADAITRAKLTDYSAQSLKSNRLKVRDALKATSNLPTVLGNVSFTGNRELSLAPLVQIVKDGKFTDISHAAGGAAPTSQTPGPGRTAASTSAATITPPPAPTITLTPARAATLTPIQRPSAVTAVPSPTRSPLPPTAKPAFLTYTVQSGDSLSSIANRFRTTVNALTLANHLSKAAIFRGQVLQIPNR